ncbi:MAG: L-aspartate oxidase [Candidatus Dichloromethanomonas elyunquensis]|nr:MAG: L-aspartate oxidase [Candidatus Dichloromethanomonas elyunquensis]
MKDSDFLIPWSKDSLVVNYTEVLVLGSGIAGLFAAIKLSRKFDVTVLTKKNIMEGNTEHAQGGIAVALNQDDSPEFHYGDTILAGAGLCNLEAVKILAEKGPECVRRLIELGTKFDRHDNELDFTKEGAHSKRRVLHARGDATGEEIERALVEVVRSRLITVKENHYVIDFIKNHHGEIAGVLVLNQISGKVEAWLAKAVVLATGGLGQLYKHTTNPELATGDGIAAAYRAGAELMDMEFIQFHPTALLLPGAPSFLISEAARGEGAKLLNVRGERFMEGIPGQELAPRDVVARAIWEQMKDSPVYLDFSCLEQPQDRFPTIYSTCLDYGIDISTTPVPIGPAAHYMMGGVKVNNMGETNLANLYACGECACNGVHGANRLASNSLLDGLVFASMITDSLSSKTFVLAKWENVRPFKGVWDINQKGSADVQFLRKQIKDIMWEKAGIIRTQQGLLEAYSQLIKFWEEFTPSLEVPHLELGNMISLGLIIAKTAMEREESRGGHYRSDFPFANKHWQKHSVLKRGDQHVGYVSI